MGKYVLYTQSNYTHPKHTCLTPLIKTNVREPSKDKDWHEQVSKHQAGW